MTITQLADTILNDTLETLRAHHAAIPDEHRQTLSRAARALARLAASHLQGQPQNSAATAREQLAARAILANLRSTGHTLAANALRDALGRALRTTAAIIQRL
jgi:hypothetical protein